MADCIAFPAQPEEPALHSMTRDELQERLQELQAQIADLDSREPEDLMSKRHEGWAERHEALEDLADDVMERLDELAEES